MKRKKAVLGFISFCLVLFLGSCSSYKGMEDFSIVSFEGMDIVVSGSDHPDDAIQILEGDVLIAAKHPEKESPRYYTAVGKHATFVVFGNICEYKERRMYCDERLLETSVVFKPDGTISTVNILALVAR